MHISVAINVQIPANEIGFSNVFKVSFLKYNLNLNLLVRIDGQKDFSNVGIKLKVENIFKKIAFIQSHHPHLE